MASKENTELSAPHPPKGESIKAFDDFAQDLKKQFLHVRHDRDKHDPECFSSVADVSDHDLVSFTADDFVEVRTALTAYGLILFGKLRIPALAKAGASRQYVHFRAFSEGQDKDATFHSFYTKETVTADSADGFHSYQVFFSKDEPLDWFES